jgi:hypothetical protein
MTSNLTVNTCSSERHETPNSLPSGSLKVLSLNVAHVRMLADKLNLRAFQPEARGLGTYKDSTGKRLDWILITQELEFVDYRVLPDVVADHLAVYAEIIFRGQQ